MYPEEFQTYLEAASVLEAQEMLKAFNVAGFPDMKKESRERLHRQVHKTAYPDEAKKVVTIEDLKNVLGSVE